MTLRTWARRLFARPATLPTREAPAGRCPTVESPEDRAPATITCKPAGGKARRHRSFAASGEQALASLVHASRFDPATIGFWLGGAGAGMGGCLLGALMPYRNPVAVAISVLWWGLYFGCFGASVGALVGELTGRAPSDKFEAHEVEAAPFALPPSDSPTADRLPPRPGRSACAPGPSCSDAAADQASLRGEFP